MRVLALLLLLAGTNIAFASASPSARSGGVAQGLPEWLESVVRPSSSAVAEASHPAHEGRHIEKDFMCLQTSLQTSCASYSLLRSNMGCCQPEGHKGHDPRSDTAFDIAQQALSVGVCTWTYTFIEVFFIGSVPLTPNVAVAPSTTLSCTLTKAAEECGPIGCGDLTLTAELDTHVVNLALVEGDATGALTLGDAGLDSGSAPGCLQTNNQGPRGGIPRAPKWSGMPALENGPFKRLAKNKTQARQGDPTTPVVGFTSFMSGPVTVSSKTHDTKWEAGWVDFFVPGFVEELDALQLEDAVAEYGPLPKLSLKDSGKFKFQFFRSDEHY